MKKIRYDMDVRIDECPKVKVGDIVEIYNDGIHCFDVAVVYVVKSNFGNGSNVLEFGWLGNVSYNDSLIAEGYDNAWFVKKEGDE